MSALLADIDIVKKRVISILNANPTKYVSTVSGDVGAFPSDQEITDAVLEADEFVCVSGYFQSVNDALSNPFAVTSGPLADQDQVPWHHGNLNKVEVSKAVLSLTQAVINTTTDIITKASHGLVTGDQITFVLVTGALPTCASPTFAVLTNYYVIKVDANTFKLARTLADAIAGNAIDILTAPTGAYLLLGWQIGVEATSLDDVTNATAVGNSYVGDGSFDALYRPQDGQIYTPAQYARVTYPEYVRTTSLQSRQAEEYLVICTTVRMLVKNASNAPFANYVGESTRGIQQLVSDGFYTQKADSNDHSDNK